jgi:hypothetical protein
MSKFLQDLRYGLRTMLKRPGFTLIAVMTLALGIGSSTAIFTVVDAAVIRGLPYRSPNELYHMFERTPQKEFDQREFSYPDYQDYLQNKVVDIAAYTGGGTILNGNGESEGYLRPACRQISFPSWAWKPSAAGPFKPTKTNRVARASSC